MNKKIVLTVFIGLFLLGALGAAGYFYKEYRDLKRNPQKVSTDEIKSVTSVIGKFMELPADEEPTLATVTDFEKLKDQSFFKNAANGDKILIYTNAKKAILYRPSTGKIIEFAPLLIGDDVKTNSEPVEATPTPEVKNTSVSVTIYNGTKTVGYAGQLEKKIGVVKDLKVTDKTNATKDDYTKSIVIDISGVNSEKAEEIASAIDGTVATLPQGEVKPETDILIIAGKEK